MDYELMREFTKSVSKMVDQIKKSGALSEDTSDALITKYAIILCSETVKPLSEGFRKELANLRHFV